MIVAGIDPGTIKTGYAVLHRDGRRIVRIDSGTIFLNSKLPYEQRLPFLYDEIIKIIVSNNPSESAVESLFFSKNANSALKLGHARGVILLAFQQHKIPINSYTPTMVKRSIVGAGRAPKGQVQKVVQAILGLKKLPQEDEADAMALAICRLNAPKNLSIV